MPETTDHHYKIAAQSGGMIVTRSGVLTLDARANLAGVRDYLLQQLIKQHRQPDLHVIHFDIKPPLR